MIEWINGRTLQPADLRQDSTIRAVADACRRLHAGPRFAADFDMFQIQPRYLRTACDAGFRLPDRYVEFMPQLEQIRTVLRRDPLATVPCHNDLLAANFISEGDRLWLIDYEYSGNNDPCFELGNIWSESNLAADQLELLVSGYFGRPQPRPDGQSQAAGPDVAVRLDAVGRDPAQRSVNSTSTSGRGRWRNTTGPSPPSTHRTWPALLTAAADHDPPSYSPEGGRP